MLSKGKGCGFVVMPSELDLPAHSCHVIQVTACSDMWGVYTDQLVCQVTSCDLNIMCFTMSII